MTTATRPPASLTAHDKLLTGTAARFAGDVASHQLQVQRDDGLYRHARFRHPGTGLYWFDLVTAPGMLAFTGDMGGFIFRRDPDMFAFFRRSRTRGGINPSYWAEKLPAGQGTVMEYSEDKYREAVLGHYADAVTAGRPLPHGLGRAVREELLNDDDAAFEDTARAALDRFEHATADAACPRCDDGITAVPPGDASWWVSRHYTATGHPATTKPGPSFRFRDTWDWEMRDFSYQFLWACHAITWGIDRWDGRAVRRPVTRRLSPAR